MSFYSKACPTSWALLSTSLKMATVGIISRLRQGGGRAANSGDSSVSISLSVCMEASHLGTAKVIDKYIGKL